MSDKTLSLKPSPVVIVKKILVAEVLVAIIVAIFTFIVDFIALYEKLPFSDVLSSSIFSILVLGIFQIIFLVALFLSWYFESYELYPKKLVHQKGIFIKSNDIRPFTSLTSIRHKEGILGRWLNYASIELADAKNSQIIVIPDIFRATEEIEKIQQFVSIKDVPTKEDKNELLEELISKGESKNLEFKESFRWDSNQGAVNKDLEQMIMRSIVGMLNSEGGKILIGVNDRGEVIGLENDLKTVKKKNLDGFENHLTTVFSSSIGAEYSQDLDVSFEVSDDGKTVCLISIRRSDEPVFYKGNGTEKFFVRAGNSTRELNPRESFKYIRTNFSDYSG